MTVAPKGEVFSWVVVHRSQTPGFEGEVPYAVVLVALDAAKGVRIVGNLVNMKPGPGHARPRRGGGVHAVAGPFGEAGELAACEVSCRGGAKARTLTYPHGWRIACAPCPPAESQRGATDGSPAAVPGGGHDAPRMARRVAPLSLARLCPPYGSLRVSCSTSVAFSTLPIPALR